MKIVYITKYALAHGVLKRLAEETRFPDVVKVADQCFHKPFWHLTREDAQEHAESMRLRRIASLRNQIDRLEKRNYYVEEAASE